MKRFAKPAMFGLFILFLLWGIFYRFNRLPSLHAASKFSAGNLEYRLKGKPRRDLLTVWGEPDGCLSGLYGDIWKLDEERQVIVYYNRDTDKVTDVRITDRLAAPEDFSFSLVWNTYGISSYDSKTGILIKENDIDFVDVYTTEMHFDRETLFAVYNSIAGLDWAYYPEEYDPNPRIKQEPPVSFVLTMRNGNTVKTIKAVNIAEEKDGADEHGIDFLTVCRSIADQIMDTEEWKSLPPYAHLFE